MNRTERNKLVVENLPLVGYLVSELVAKATHLSRDDLASAGALGLISAADSFNPELGVPFGAYARQRVLGAFADELRSSDWATRSARKRIKETLAVQESLTAALGRSPSVDELAAAMGVDRKSASEAVADASRTVSPLDDLTAEFLEAETVLPEDSLLHDERIAYLHAAIEALPPKMRHIVREVYFEDRSVGDVAAELGITHSAVSQQRTEAIRLLRDGLRTHYADGPGEVELESRIAVSSRSAYLGRLADRAAAGMSRMAKSPLIAGTTAAS
ncbi:sigma-70 family RNA polymerase sigma factor [Cryobacterium sp. BB736]|uniref:sigma-70 family RNA polymerase sigma factor n=1 Tax=Cryobacterium sp. BB736 TaxID=2746963 RepID=UPI001873B7ED|nr:sigma-70 family RNA polymerase sigma factor [Cryobacterium sp. BB736]